MGKNETPYQLGYRMPAEWEAHSATWLAWPHNRDTWPGRFNQALSQYAGFARCLAEYEPLHVLAGGDDVMANAKSLLGEFSNVTLHKIRTDDAWIRDFGPMFISKPGQPPALIDWRYNAWGGKYPPYDHDAAATKRIAGLLGVRRFAPGIVLEGGAIEGNGQGVVLTTSSCLLNPNRNPLLTAAEIEGFLADFLGASTVVWLDGEIAGDDTDGHVDQLVRFVSPQTVVVATEVDRSDVNYESLRVVRQQLRQVVLPESRRLEIVELPMPAPVTYEGRRLPASYANFYLANSSVIVPQFDDSADVRAWRILQELFPDREVLGLPSRELIWGLGAFHCLTQQQPAG